MPEQPPAERVRNFSAVALGYTLENARRESERCLMCVDPKCIAGCPVRANIPAFIRKICEGNYRGAYDVLTDRQSVAGHLRPRMSAGEPVRGSLHRGRDVGAGGRGTVGTLGG